MWLHYLASGHDDQGRALVISDPGAAALAAKLRDAGGAQPAVQAALSHDSVFGRDPWPDAFVARLAAHLSVLRRGGAEALLAHGAR
jgi:fructuronate reductase